MIWIIMWIGMLFLFNFQLRYLQTLSSIAAEHNSTIIFPMPMNILDHFMGKKSKDQELDALEDTFWAQKSIQTHNNDIYMNKYKYNQIYLWRLYKNLILDRHVHFTQIKNIQKINIEHVRIIWNDLQVAWMSCVMKGANG